MGHDISAYYREEIAYYRKTSFDATNLRLYKLLDCMDFYDGCSGIGHRKKFNRNEILEAYENAKEFDWKEEMEFLEKIIKTKHESVEIYFG